MNVLTKLLSINDMEKKSIRERIINFKGIMKKIVLIIY